MINGDQLKAGFQKPRMMEVQKHTQPTGELSDQKHYVDIGRIGRPYKALLPRDLVISMALLYLPKDGTDWPPRLQSAHKQLSESWLIGDAADVPAKVALHAFESMGYQYVQIENGEWRGRLGSIAFKHWTLFRNGGEVSAT